MTYKLVSTKKYKAMMKLIKLVIQWSKHPNCSLHNSDLLGGVEEYEKEMKG